MGYHGRPMKYADIVAVKHWVSVLACGHYFCRFQVPRIQLRAVAGTFWTFFTFFTIILMVLLTSLNGLRLWNKNQKEYFLDYTNDAFYAAVHQRQGIILPGTGIGSLDVSTRRAILYNAGPAYLNYVPQASPEMERIFKKIYGVDFLNPPLDVVRIGRNLPPELVKALWVKRTLFEWQAIKEEFHVMDIITQKDWSLQLSLVASNDKFSLYAIP